MKKKLALILADTSLIIFSYLTAFVLRLDFEGVLGHSNIIITSLPVLIIVTLIIFIRMGMYNAIWRYASVDNLITTTKAVTFSVFLSVVIIFFLQTERTPRSIFIIHWLLFFMMAGGIRFSARIRDSFYKPRNKGGRRILIYGAGKAGQMITKEMRCNPSFGYIPVCFVDDNPDKIGSKLHNLPIYSGSSNLEETIRKNRIEDVLIAIPSTSGNKIKNIIEKCKVSGVKFKTLPSLSDIVDGSVSVTQIREVKIDDLLRRAPKDLDMKQIINFIKGKSVMVTGAGGSIGSELARQTARYRPSVEMLVENHEYSLYKIDSELKESHKNIEFHSMLENVIEPKKLEGHLKKIDTDIIFHSAAYKHVPMVESNSCEAIINNILGTVKVVKLADKYKVKKVVFISSDKAIRPTSVMGATKRICELYIQNFNKRSNTEFVVVRFGNVLGSSGSIVPKFVDQINKGGPVTITHPEVTRYFMLIPEAVQLILQAASIGKGGEIFILDMGKPVKILNMAKDMIQMLRSVSDKRIKINYTGLRPGEKLHEELLINHTDKKTKYKSITIAGITNVEWEEFENDIDELLYFSQEGNVDAAIHVLKKIVSEFNPQNKIFKEILKKPFMSGPHTLKIPSRKILIPQLSQHMALR